MNKPRCASAPGKMVLIGEYAVTCGLPALSMAINRRAEACCKPAKNSYHYLYSSLAKNKQYRFTVKDGQIHWQEKTPDTEMISFVQRLTWPDTVPKNNGLALTLDSETFYTPAPTGSENKIGIGSSAALLLAANRAIDSSEKNVLAQHIDMQQQLGSGIDLATSTMGGLICYQKDRPSQALQLPPNFYWRAVWTGNSAKTRHFLRAFESWRHLHEAKWQIYKQRAASIIAAAITATGRADGLGLTANMRAYGEWMRDLGTLIGASIYTPAFEEIRTLCQTETVAWKPSGAGGGDIGIICTDNKQKLSQISRTIRDAGYTILNLEIELEGLKDNTG